MEQERSKTERPLAMITGASSGLGATFARRLANAGYDLVLVARRRERLETLAQELRQSYGILVEALAADLSKDEDIRSAEERIQKANNFEFLVNNAGFGTLPLFHKVDIESQDRMHHLHILATLRLTRAALPILIARKKGFIVNVSSVAGFLQGPGNVSYCATKAWMNSFTEGLHLELRLLESDVRLQVLCPGFTITEFHDTLGVGRGFVSESWWMSAGQVVDASLEGLRRGKLFVIPGLRYKLIVLLRRFLPAFVFQALAVRGAISRMKQAAQRKPAT